MSVAVTLRVFIPFMAGYFLSYLFRSINNVIAPDLVRDLGIDAAGLGLLTGAYLVTFAAFQVPLGILLDRFGPRRTEAVLLLFAAAGALVFALAQSVPMLIVGRGLIGLGVSACLMAAFKAFADWLPAHRLPLANGIIFATGGVGMMMATIPVEMALGVTDWRGVFLFLAACSLVFAILVRFMVPERPAHLREGHGETLSRQFGDMMAIFRSRTFLAMAPFSVATQATTIAVLGLWSGPWLRDVAGWGREAVAEGLFIIALSLTISYFTMGTIASWVNRRGGSTVAVSAVGMVIYLFVQVLVAFDLNPWPMTTWILYAAFGTCGGLMYAAFTQVFPARLAGRVNTALNLLVFIYAFAIQWGMGAVINLWPVAADGGFAAEGYGAGFTIALLLQVLTLVWWGAAAWMWRASKAA